MNSKNGNYTKWKEADYDAQPNSLDHMHYNKVRKKGALPEKDQSAGYSNSTAKMASRDNRRGTEVSQKAMNSVSQDRQEYLRALLEQRTSPGEYPTARSIKNETVIRKEAAAGTIAGCNVAGRGNTVHVAPDLYSPLFLSQNLQLPRDLVTANAWNRAFYETNPLVRNAINLHATYPISKLNLKCEDPHIEKWFLDMAERVDLEAVIQHTASEFWKLGEAFVYSAFDETSGSWSKIYHHNPDFISVHQASIPGVTTIALKPDEQLRKIVTSSDPMHMRIRETLDPRIVQHVLNNEYIPLDSFNISHLKNLSSPYDVRGTSIITSVWKDLMLWDKIRECFDVDTEVLTRDGFKKYEDVIEINSHGKAVPKQGIQVACYNSKNEEMEFHKPLSAVLKPYNGEMLNFVGQKMDVMVTPNHRMYVSKDTKNGWTPYGEMLAKDITSGSFYKFKCNAGWSGDYCDEYIEAVDREFPMDIYLKFMGYLISEGCLHRRGYQSSISLSQATDSDCYEDMRDTFRCIAEIMGRKLSESTIVNDSGFSEHAPKEMWRATLCDKEFCEFLIHEIGTSGRAKSRDKKIPRWAFCLPQEKIQILLNALVKGDGSEIVKNGTKRVQYSTASRQLSNDVYELVYRTGLVPNMSSTQRPTCLEYRVLWTETNYGNEPTIYNNPNHAGAKINKIQYDDYVWCLEVPTDLLIVRRNGKICIQHNCKLAQADGMINPMTLVKVGAAGPDGFYPTAETLEQYRQILEAAQFDKDFKLVTHDAVSIERIGYNGGVMDVNADLTMLIDNIFIGLMIPKSVVTQEGATYASASVALDVMRQRYINFRNMMANWLEQKIFAPLAEVHGFYKVEGRTKRLVIPQVEWNHMTLYDLDNYLGHILGLVDKKQVSLSTVYRSLGLSRENEINNIRAEMIQSAIIRKEEAELGKMSLSELRALDPTKMIPEKEKPALPGVPGGPGGLPGADMMGGMGGLGGPGGMPGGGGLPPPGPDLGAPPGGPGMGPPGAEMLGGPPTSGGGGGPTGTPPG